MIGLKFKFLLPEPRKRPPRAKTVKRPIAKAGKRAAVKA
jgi:hypothetical protein